MNLEAIDWYRQSKYLNEKLMNSRIQRIYMPTPTSLLLQCRGASTLNLLCDLGNNGPAVYLPEKAPETPDTPPAFCMLLRKHLEDGHIVRIETKKFRQSSVGAHQCPRPRRQNRGKRTDF
ncbi:MAG: NFACT family protein [Phascolarctobacterium sp.]|nr:NFACT family protein [Candidatus Phascolarctobacterium equi]